MQDSLLYIVSTLIVLLVCVIGIDIYLLINRRKKIRLDFLYGKFFFPIFAISQKMYFFTFAPVIIKFYAYFPDFALFAKGNPPD